ncbi:Bug family tripartite tricarboxylate transporter substrate binding protein [Phreatobacter oligotrophus]|jgi:tripartite-type tricarboxylate transporter receptor subunit TctC|uniref:Bug family tripartite tricarboxylate transporter substrate binding protein n=1 Tax=Phreatobacter oligotrophus TaxID=1122261 RepID=UPI0023530C2F|nr:tripartite tricarboxylate transporter substrate binding protein [Phreatobacter oligotrophus]MBX9992093.1 tripartite tricarboxylate transporter substrate binding protein [Phreatobacter oligotrophus]
MTGRTPAPIDRRTALAGGLAALAAPVIAPGIARAQAWPARPVRVVVPYSAGGGADTVGRILFQKLASLTGGSFVIENRGGAGGTIGANAVATAEADGYTILFDASAHASNPTLFPRLPYDTVKAFRPVFLAAVVPNVLVVHPSVAEKTVAEIIAAAKRAPGRIDWASSGNGSAQHLALELFKSMAGVDITHVPYRGGGPALNDLVAGQIKYFFSNLSSSIEHIRGGLLRAVAHTATTPVEVMPGLPAVADTLAGYQALEWNGVFVPAGTPDTIVARLSSALNEAISDPAISARLTSLSVTSRPNTPDEFAAFVRAEMEKWGPIIRSANIRL